DGNYLNYRVNPVLVDARRIDIVNNVAKPILNSISDINVAIMRFNDNQGGPVILDIQDLDTNRAAILATIDGIDAAGATPVSETMYEAARFWRGLPAYYGETVDEHPTDPNALASPDPEVYEQPQSEVCAKNFNVLLTDGAPNSDDETPSLVDNLPDWFATHQYTGCTGTNQGDCLDDITGYLQNDDISTAAGEQVVTTHTIGFAVDLPILQAAAVTGGGDYFLADDVESLTIALLEIVNNITDRSLSFAAPAISVNTFNRTQNLNDLYMTTFAAREKYHWPGNLKKYQIIDGQIVDQNGDPAVNAADGLFLDSASSFWSSGDDGSDVEMGGALENLPLPDDRKLYTDLVSNDLTATANEITATNAGSFSLADLGLTGAAGEPTKDELIRWARGEDVQDEDFNPMTTSRKAMGDPLHSQPAAVVYGGSPTAPELVVYVATNDGYVHAIDGSDGSELWAFIPKEHLPNLPNLYVNADASFKSYGVDGDIVPITADRDRDGIIEPSDGDFVYIVFGMRRGGNSYYALDVTDRDSPEVKWRVSAAEFGQTWSKPTIARVDIDDNRLNADKGVVIVGGGYDNVHDTLPHPTAADTQGAGVFFLDLESGDVLWRAGTDTGANLELADLTRSIPSQVRVIDISGDGFADRMYASDMGGQILRFDITNGNDPDSLVTGGVVAQLGAEGNGSVSFEDTRRFYNTPDVSLFNDNIQNRRFIAISLGSGYRSHPLDNTNSDRFYSIRDKAVFNSLTQDEYDNLTPITDADLVEISGQVGTVIGQNQAGWKLTLPDDQKVLSTSATFNNEIFFVAFSPAAAEAENCAAGVGRNFLYRVTVANGDPIADLDNVVPGTEDQLRVEDLAQGGIAPSPAFLFPSPDPSCTGAACSPPPIGCVGVECFDP
ncbi:MAG: PQQ-binding-like beta-propeller repeat protein, partial [Gammaproteobacteria bacterium]|nr:PQQ-binding-like beta-propeller repeat protein [Gammaproteobacteria bacterium]